MVITVLFLYKILEANYVVFIRCGKEKFTFSFLDDFQACDLSKPRFLVVSSSVLCSFVQTIDAMDTWEDLTELGYHLADLPVEPHLGKMVLCAVVLKCLDPILTIACTLAYRDPFVLPTQASQKRAAMLCRKRFTAGTFSDHMALLRAFQVLFSIVISFLNMWLYLGQV